MPVYGGTTTEQATSLQRRPNMPGLPQGQEHVLPYLEALDRAITDFYGRLSERLQFWDNNAGLATGVADATTVTVTFAGLEEDTRYIPVLISNWEAGGLHVTDLTTGGFTINASRSPVTDGTVLWAVIRQQNTTTTLASVAANPLGVADGGTGAATLTGYLKGSGTGAITAQTVPIPVVDGGTGTTTALAHWLLQNLAATTIIALTTSYFGFGDTAAFATEASAETVLPTASTVRNLYVRTTTAQPGTGTMVVTVRKNGAGTTLTVTIAAGAAAGNFSDTTNSFTVAAGDRIAVQVVNNALAASAALGSFAVTADLN